MFTYEKLRNAFCVNSPSIVCTDSADDGRAARMCVFLRNRCTLAGCVCVCVRVGLVEREGKAEILTGSKTAALCQRCRVFLPRAWEPSERERERDVTHTHTHTHTAL